ncbi:hypothetical protein TRM7615_00292 [Falsiruegeria mediterranea M17]|uniref:Uncharacterized protein n=1 Tax=Falsiruegeria mediterranea M17 TaxID=1200281 RepID=A0A2R8C3B3_9RHOB|nr:hypothetical protein TRM7615_00292 [Falsiruegeria mediterranea M17]
MIRKAGLPFGAWVPLPFAVTLSHRVFLREARAKLISHRSVAKGVCTGLGHQY